ncbi:MAG: hypothetical protein GF315_05050, partial [candidate division Zixibacteria bacterium]|nr:hypothetical protein [candidate division Zixibacteria bacterium]
MVRIFTVIAILLISVLPATAEWPEGGVLFGGAFEPLAHYCKVAPDGQGGMWAVWQDLDRDIRMQHIDNQGNLMWEYPGQKVTDDTYIQSLPELCPDRHGGIVVAFKDYRHTSKVGYPDIYAQRIDAYGNEVWLHNGLPVVIDIPREQYDFHMVSHVDTLTIIAWSHAIDWQYAEVRAQCLNEKGERLWMDDTLGLVITGGEEGRKRDSGIWTDSSGYIYVTWNDKTDDSLIGGIYAQKIDVEGNTYWDENGIK